MPRLSRKYDTGFTLIEAVIVVAVAGVLTAIAAPSFDRWQQDQRLKSTGREVVSALSFARSEAIRTGNNHIVFVMRDTTGGALQDSDGNTVAMVVVNDNRPGDAQQNCLIDAGETVGVVRFQDDVDFGVTAATSSPSTDFGGGVIASGTSFTKPDNSAATWMHFRSDGTPIAFSATCTPGTIGSGSGAVYLTNDRRDFTAVVTPLGAIHLVAYDSVAGQWVN